MQAKPLSVELYRQEGKDFRSVRARIDSGKFIIDTQDMGETVEEMFDTDDYEFWTTVPKNAWGDLLMAFAVEFLTDDPKATDRVRDICKKHNIEHKWDSWV